MNKEDMEHLTANREKTGEVIREALKARKFMEIETLRMGMQMIDLGTKWRTENERDRGDT